MIETFSCRRDSLTVRGHVYRLGDGAEKRPAVILCHGFLANDRTLRVYAQALAELRDRRQTVAVRLTANTEAKLNIARRASELTELDERYGWMLALSRTANGELVGKEKITLETYVQMTCFDRILRVMSAELMNECTK